MTSKNPYRTLARVLQRSPDDDSRAIDPSETALLHQLAALTLSLRRKQMRIPAHRALVARALTALEHDTFDCATAVAALELSRASLVVGHSDFAPLIRATLAAVKSFTADKPESQSSVWRTFLVAPGHAERTDTDRALTSAVSLLHACLGERANAPYGREAVGRWLAHQDHFVQLYRRYESRYFVGLRDRLPEWLRAGIELAERDPLIISVEPLLLSELEQLERLPHEHDPGVLRLQLMTSSNYRLVKRALRAAEQGALAPDHVYLALLLERYTLVQGASDFTPLARALAANSDVLDPHHLWADLTPYTDAWGECDRRNAELIAAEQRLMDGQPLTRDASLLCLTLGFASARLLHSRPEQRPTFAHYLALEAEVFAGLRDRLARSIQALLHAAELVRCDAISSVDASQFLDVLGAAWQQPFDRLLTELFARALMQVWKLVEVPLEETAAMLARLPSLSFEPLRPYVRRQLRRAFRQRYPDLESNLRAARPKQTPLTFTLTHHRSPYATTKRTSLTHPTLGSVEMYVDACCALLPQGAFALVAWPRLVDVLAEFYADKWATTRAPTNLPAAWSAPSTWQDNPVLATVVPSAIDHPFKAARQRKRVRTSAARVLTSLIRAWALDEQLSDAGAAALQKRAYRELGRVPWPLNDSRFYELASARLKSDLFLHRAPWAAVAKVCDDPERLDPSNTVAELEDWLALFAAKGAGARPPKSTRKLLMNWPAALSMSWATALTGHHVQWQPRSYLEAIYSVVLPLHPRPDLVECLAAHPNAPVVRRATDSEIRAGLRLARRRAGLFHRREPRLRKVLDHATLVRFVLDDPRPYQGRWPALVLRAIDWHDHERWQQHEEGNDQPWRHEPFPELPAVLPDDISGFVEHINSAERLSAESSTMRHCVESYGPRLVSGQSFVFHVTYEDDEATVQTDPLGRVVQAYGWCNRHNKASRWALQRGHLFDVARPSLVDVTCAAE